MANSPVSEVGCPTPTGVGGVGNTSDKFIVLYDGGCGMCRTWIERLKKLDKRNRTAPVPVSQEVLSRIDRRLRLDDCMQALHVVTPERRVYIGWDAVARLARLFPLTWLVGALGVLPGLRHLGRLLYRYIAAHRHQVSQCQI